MSLVSSFTVRCSVARSPEGARAPEADEALAEAGAADLDALLEVAAQTHGPSGRTRETFEARLAAGMSAWILRKAGRPASCLWLARGGYSVFPVRLRIELAPGTAYVFDECTGADFRRQGMLGKLVKAAWEKEKLEAAMVCIRTDNVASLAANEKVGFRPVCDVEFRRVVLVRLHSVSALPGGATRTFPSLARAGDNPTALLCRLSSAAGLGDFRLGRADAPADAPGAQDF